MTIQEKIEKIFAGESDNRPEWASELLTELQEIKSMLKETKQEKKAHDYTFYDFVNVFRKSMMPDVQNNIYPEVEYAGKKIGVNYRGLLYYKGDLSLLSKNEAFKVYRHIYDNKKYAV